MQDIQEIERKINSLEDRLSSLELTISGLQPPQGPQAIAHEAMTNMSKEEAKQAILKLFQEKGELDYYDIISTLDLDLKLVVEICAQLEQEKRIEGIE